MAYSYFPRPAEVERRERWYRSCLLGPMLHAILGPRFRIPLELCERIAAYCPVREWAAAASRAFWEKRCRVPELHQFDLSREVWARYVEFEGVRYVAQLTNEPGDQPELASFSLLYTPTGSERLDRLYVAEDYLGIREVLFVASFAMPLVHGLSGVWWKRLKIFPGYFFETRSDLIKLRSILVLNPDLPKFSMNNRASHLKPAWEKPQPPMGQVYWHQIFDPDAGMLRMTSFICNGPGTMAYSVCCDSRPYTIHAHTGKERDYTFYRAEDLPDRKMAVWLYAPIAPDERVAEVWVRHWETDSYIYHAAFVLQTDQDRTFVLGSHPADFGWGANSYTLVYRADENPGRIYFDISPVGIHDLALEVPLPPQPAAGQPPLPQSESPCPRHHEEDEDYFYSAAVLDGVVAVTPCHAAQRGIIVGLVLHYSDGRQASLGQVRLDWLQEPAAVGIVDHPAGQMWLRFALSPSGCPNVVAIDCSLELRPPQDAETDLHFRVSLRGTLEWWFSHRQCRLWHDGRSSPPTVRGKHPSWADM